MTSEPAPATKSIGKHLVAIGWLVGFTWFFFSLSLPNNGNIKRNRLWSEAGIYILDALDPPSGEDSPPAGFGYLSQRIDLLIVAAFVLATALSLGRLALRPLSITSALTTADRHAIAGGIGLALLSLTTLLLGLAGLLSRPLYLVGMSLVIAIELALTARERRTLSAQQNPSDARPGITRLQQICLFAAVPFLIAIVLGAMLPSTDFDVKEYHLQGPKEFYQTGRISMLEHNVYTSFPFLTEMLSLTAMVVRGDWFRGALAGKAVLSAFAPLTALMLYAAGRRWFSAGAGAMAALVYLSTPWTYRISTIAYVEGGLSFYLLAATYVTGLAVAHENRSPWLIAAGLLAGSAMACKYPALLSVIAPMTVLVIVGTGLTNWRRAAISVVVFGLSVMIVMGPWLIKNFTETGNPFYPLAYSLLGGDDWSPEMNAKWLAAHSPDDHNVAEIPRWMIDVSAQNDWLSPLLYGLAPLVFLVPAWRRRSGALACLLAYIFFYWWTMAPDRIDRFWVPMLPVVALLAGAGAAWSRTVVWRTALGIVTAATLYFNLALICSGGAGYNAFLIDLDYARRWTAELTAPEIALLNARLGPDDRVLMVGEAEVFDAEFPLVYNTVFDFSIFEQWVGTPDPDIASADRTNRPTAEIRETFQREGITYVLVNWAEILRYRGSYGYTDFVTPSRFEYLQNAGILGDPATIYQGYRDWQSLSDTEKQIIQTWAPQLIRPSPTNPNERVMVTSQIFPVLPAGE